MGLFPSWVCGRTATLPRIDRQLPQRAAGKPAVAPLTGAPHGRRAAPLIEMCKRRAVPDASWRKPWTEIVRPIRRAVAIERSNPQSSWPRRWQVAATRDGRSRRSGPPRKLTARVKRSVDILMGTPSVDMVLYFGRYPNGSEAGVLAPESTAELHETMACLPAGDRSEPAAVAPPFPPPSRQRHAATDTSSGWAPRPPLLWKPGTVH